MRVVEISDSENAAAYAGKLFARWGAEVIKVETPYRQQVAEADNLYLNAGKRHIKINYFDDSQRDLFSSILSEADIVLTDLSPKILDEYRIFECASNNSVKVSITPFGLSGPYRDYEATETTILAQGGYTFLSGDIGRTPLTLPGRYPYYQAGTFAYIAAIAQYLSGVVISEKETIEISIFETVVGLHQFTDVMWSQHKDIRSRHGNQWQNLCPTTMVRCADGWVGVNILPRFWEPFAFMLGMGEKAHDIEYAENSERMKRVDEITSIIEDAFSDLDRATLFKTGQETWRVPIGIQQSLGEVLGDEHLRFRNFWKTINYGNTEVQTAGSPFKFAGEEVPEENPPQTYLPEDIKWETKKNEFKNPRYTNVQPLKGLRVLDLTRIWSGPLATRILGDMGAEIIKIEAQDGRGPRKVTSSADKSGYYPDNDPGVTPWNRQGLNNKLNRNKKSLAINLKANRGREVFLELVEKSDVVIENFSARAMPSLGLDYFELKKRNSQIIYVAMPAFGLSGPYREYIGLGPSIEPLTGVCALLGYSSEEPRMSVQALTDAMSGTAATAAVMTALERRNRTNEGSFVELSQHECGVGYFGEYFLASQLNQSEPQIAPNLHNDFAPNGVYRCLGDDEWIAISIRSDSEWYRLCTLVEKNWENEDKFNSITNRKINKILLDELIDNWTKDLDKVELMKQLQKISIPAGVVNSSPEWLNDEHLLERGYFFSVEELDAGEQSYDGSPVKFYNERGYDSWVRSPGLGEHYGQILGEILGYSSLDITELFELGIIVDSPSV
ncbi:MAG: hypothetical protein CL792_02610 [Chloroflexi bacterium]|nr:hypothetical protein [Chloroflexota bacterium]|tara:strand:- start:8966 stop:11317 length:2352 start_codon:yes stop_codon:yes gene_type:complete